MSGNFHYNFWVDYNYHKYDDKTFFICHYVSLPSDALSALLHMDFRILLLFISTFLAHMLTLIIYHTILLSIQTLHEKYPNTEFFLVCIFLCLDWIQENTDQKKLRIWTLFKQWDCLFPSTLCPNLQVQIIS